MISLPSCRSRSEPDRTAAIYRSPIPFSPTPIRKGKKMTATPNPSDDRYAHLRKEREKEQAQRRGSKRQRPGQAATLQAALVSSRDPLLNYKKPRLVTALRTARAERDQMEQQYQTLLQEHMHCGLAIARLETQLAEHLAFLERFRLSLQREEHGPQS